MFKQQSDPSIYEEKYRRFLSEVSFFQSDAFVPDTKFNRLHKVCFWWDFPSPPPFQINETQKFKDGLDVFLKKYKRRSELLKMASITIIEIPLLSIAEFVGMNKNGIQKPLANHDKKLRAWRGFFLLLQIAPVFPVVGLIMVLALLFVLFRDSPTVISTQSIIFLLVVVLGVAAIVVYLFQIYFLVIGRLLSFFATTKYAESLCVREILYILMELKNKYILDNVDIKLNLQYRLNRLARLTRLLAVRFRSRDAENQLLVEQHFRSMAYYLYEWERKLIHPTASTIRSTRKEFSALALIYIKKSYGEFTVQHPKAVAPVKQSSGFIKGLLRFIGLVLPLILLALYLSNPALLPFIKLDSRAVTFMFVGWLFIGIDSFFSLGVLKDLLSIAKGVKDLGA